MADRLELVSAIFARIREGKLGWEELSATGFMARVGDARLVVDRPGNMPAMRITDESGKTLETIEEPVWDKDGRELLREIYELARRRALRVDETLSDLQRNLDKL